MFGVVVMSGCGQGETSSPPPIASSASSVSSERKEQIYDLARKYVSGKQDTRENIRKDLDEIYTLRGSEAKLFHEALDKFDTQQPVTEEEKAGELIYREMVKYADSKGVTVMSLPREETERVTKEVMLRLYQEGLIKIPSSSSSSTSTTTSFGPVCLPPYVNCGDPVSFDAKAKGGSCGAGCTNATGSDRTSNDQCELIYCDHRIWFPTNKNTVAGLTRESRCVVDYYGALPSRLGGGGYREIGSGATVPFDCKIYSGVTAYLQNNLVIF
jgi:hypothetical protein